MGLLLLVLDSAQLSAPSVLHTSARMGSSLSAYGLVRLDSLPVVLDLVSIGSSSPLQIFAKTGSSLSLFGVAWLGFLSLALDLTHADVAL
eukprot:1653245-Amphidinium_carterae.2